MHTVLFLLSIQSVGLAGDTHAIPVAAQVSNKMGLEIAMQQAQLAVENASILVGQTIWRSDPSGLIHPHGSLHWRTMQGSDLLEPKTDPTPTRQRYCQTTPGHDPVPGDRRIQVLEGADRDAPPTMVLGTTPSHEVLLVSLNPGDTVQVTAVTHTTSGQTREIIKLERGGESLELRRQGDGAEACFAYPS